MNGFELRKACKLWMLLGGILVIFFTPYPLRDQVNELNTCFGIIVIMVLLPNCFLMIEDT